MLLAPDPQSTCGLDPGFPMNRKDRNAIHETPNLRILSRKIWFRKSGTVDGNQKSGDHQFCHGQKSRFLGDGHPTFYRKILIMGIYI